MQQNYRTTTAMMMATATIVLANTVALVSEAWATDVDLIDIPRTWIFVQNCDYAMIEGLSIPNSETVCFPRASIINIEQNVELLRQVFPSDIFVFTYDLRDASTARDFTLFLRSHDNNAPAGALGRAFVDEGYAIAANNQLVVSHEWLHVSTCSVAHDEFGQPDTTRRIGVFPWC
jgi:hypothetical protein